MKRILTACTIPVFCLALQFCLKYQASAGTNCSPAYPGVCIPPPPPDLDCRDISYRRFKVLPPDPHKFDSDRDGIGCER